MYAELFQKQLAENQDPPKEHTGYVTVPSAARSTIIGHKGVTIKSIQVFISVFSGNVTFFSKFSGKIFWNFVGS